LTSFFRRTRAFTVSANLNRRDKAATTTSCAWHEGQANSSRHLSALCTKLFNYFLPAK